LERQRQQKIIADFERRGFLLDTENTFGSDPVLPSWAINAVPMLFDWKKPAYPGLFIDSFFHRQCNPDETFTDDDLRNAAGLTGLRHIFLSDMPITDAGLVHLKGLSSLDGLVLHHIRITDAGAANLRGLTNLELLDLAHTLITDAGLVNLAGMTKLERLYFSTTTYPELQPAGGRNPPRRATLPETAITDAGLVHLKGLKRLRQLILENMQITDAGLTHLAGLQNLEFIDLKGTKVTPAGIARLQAALPGAKIEGPKVAKRDVRRRRSKKFRPNSDSAASSI
jgi:hypothetical protein